jgi:hypothetical protein
MLSMAHYDGKLYQIPLALLSAHRLMSTIFISYNRTSEAIVKNLVDDIEALGHKPWFDQDLSGGHQWWEEILKQIRACDVFIFILSPESLDSMACKRELDYANNLGKPILPVLVTDGISTNLLPHALSQIQFVDYRDQDRQVGIRLAKAIASVPPPRSLPNPLPPPPDVPISYLGGLAAMVEMASQLDYEKQSALLIDLKRSLHDHETSQDACVLLGKLRKRRDLLASIAEEIDELLDASKRVVPVVPSTDKTDSPSTSAGKAKLSIVYHSIFIFVVTYILMVALTDHPTGNDMAQLAISAATFTAIYFYLRKFYAWIQARRSRQ